MVNPPKLPVTSLSVLNSWEDFMDYWSPKLKSLEVLKFPVEDCFIRNLISRSGEVERFRCEYFFVGKYFPVSQSTQFVFNLKSLRIHRLEIDEAKREWCFSKFLANKSLRDIDLSIHTVEDFDTINCLLRTKREHKNKYLKMSWVSCVHHLCYFNKIFYRKKSNMNQILTTNTQFAFFK